MQWVQQMHLWRRNWPLPELKARFRQDEVIIAMKRIGDSLPVSLKETADGGLADTPTARKLQEQFFGKQE